MGCCYEYVGLSAYVFIFLPLIPLSKRFWKAMPSSIIVHCPFPEICVSTTVTCCQMCVYICFTANCRIFRYSVLICDLISKIRIFMSPSTCASCGHVQCYVVKCSSMVPVVPSHCRQGCTSTYEQWFWRQGPLQMCQMLYSWNCGCEFWFSCIPGCGSHCVPLLSKMGFCQLIYLSWEI